MSGWYPINKNARFLLVDYARLCLLCALVLTACAPRHSQHTVHYPNGQERWTVELVNGSPNGPSASWHRNGETSRKGHYLNGVEHGLFFVYDTNGTLLAKKVFRRGREVWSGTGSDELPDEILAWLPSTEKAVFDRQSMPLAAETTRVATPNHGYEPAQFTTMSIDPVESSTRIQFGVQQQDRAALSSNLALAHRIGKGIVLANLGNALFDGSAKTWAAVGGGYELF